MKYIYSIVISLFLLGCSTNDIDYTLARMAGNKPAQFFYFATPEKVEQWYFETKDYMALPPKTYKKDWELMSPWNGAYIYGGISFGIENPDVNEKGLSIGYGINMSSDIREYTDTDKKVEKNIKNFPPQRTRSDGETINVDLHYEKHGKENYPCIVNSSYNLHRGIYKKYYGCYKFNPEKTKAKKVGITFIYTKSPNLPEQYKHLTDEYTYEDLLKRSQRVLDSLYIKDGWEK
jgi:hypothetical protein